MMTLRIGITVDFRRVYANVACSAMQGYKELVMGLRAMVVVRAPGLRVAGPHRISGKAAGVAVLDKVNLGSE